MSLRLSSWFMQQVREGVREASECSCPRHFPLYTIDLRAMAALVLVVVLDCTTFPPSQGSARTVHCPLRAPPVRPHMFMYILHSRP